MKNLSNKIKTTILTAAIIFISASSFGQKIQFTDYTLGFLQSIPYSTTYDDIIAMGASNSAMELTKTINADKTETLNFKAGARKITIVYSKDKKFIYAMTSSEKGEFGDKTAEQLLENNFESTHSMKKDVDAFGPVTWYYNKASYPYEFAIYSAQYINTRDVFIFNKEFGSLSEFKK